MYIKKINSRVFIPILSCICIIFASSFTSVNADTNTNYNYAQGSVTITTTPVDLFDAGFEMISVIGNMRGNYTGYFQLNYSTSSSSFSSFTIIPIGCMLETKTSNSAFIRITNTSEWAVLILGAGTNISNFTISNITNWSMTKQSDITTTNSKIDTIISLLTTNNNYLSTIVNNTDQLETELNNIYNILNDNSLVSYDLPLYQATAYSFFKGFGDGVVHYSQSDLYPYVNVVKNTEYTINFYTNQEYYLSFMVDRDSTSTFTTMFDVTSSAGTLSSTRIRTNTYPYKFGDYGYDLSRVITYKITVSGTGNYTFKWKLANFSIIPLYFNFRNDYISPDIAALTGIPYSNYEYNVLTGISSTLTSIYDELQNQSQTDQDSTYNNIFNIDESINTVTNNYNTIYEQQTPNLPMVDLPDSTTSDLINSSNLYNTVFTNILDIPYLKGIMALLILCVIIVVLLG